jgi:hypothetical protein
MGAEEFPARLYLLASLARVLRFQSPPVEPCVRFSRTRLTKVVHRQHSTFAARTGKAWGIDSPLKTDQTELIVGGVEHDRKPGYVCAAWR